MNAFRVNFLKTLRGQKASYVVAKQAVIYADALLEALRRKSAEPGDLSRGS